MPIKVPSISPDVRGGGFSAPVAENYAQRQSEQTGQAINNALDTAEKIQNDMQMQANQLRIDDASVQAQNIMMKRQQEFMQYKGKDAIQRGDKSLDQEFDELLTKDFEEIGKSLGNDAQRQAWHLQSNDMRLSFSSKVNNYMLGEYKTYNDSVQQGKISTGLQMIAQNPDTKSEDYQRGKMAIINGVASINQGMDADFVKTKTIEALTPAHVSVIDGYLTSGNVQAARDYFAMPDVQNELTVTAKSKLSNVLTVAANEFNGQELGRAAISALGENASRKAIDAYILEKAGNNPDVIKYARTEANYQAELIKDSKQQADNALLEPAQLILGNADRDGVLINKNNPIFKKIALRNPQLYMSVMDKIDAHNQQLEARTAERANRLLSIAEKNKENAEAQIIFNLAKDPELFKGKDITPDIINMVDNGQLSPSSGTRIIKSWKELKENKAGTRQQFLKLRTADQYLNDILNTSYMSDGVGSSVKKFSTMDDDRKDEIRARLRTQIDSELMQIQEIEQKPMLDTDVKKVVENIFRQAVISDFSSRETVNIIDEKGFKSKSIEYAKSRRKALISQSDIDLLVNNNTQQNRNDFDKTYGTGMADYILRGGK